MIALILSLARTGSSNLSTLDFCNNGDTNDMTGFLINFERMAMQFDPRFLIGVGLAVALVGLFLWLGGLGFRKLLVVILGAVIGGIWGLFIIRQNIIALFSVAVAAIVAKIFERIFIQILAAILVAAFSIIILASPYVDSSIETIPVTPVTTSESALTLSVQGSLQTVQTYAANCFKLIAQASTKMPMYRWIIIVVVTVITILLGLSLWYLASAFSCAALGTILIYAGMILLLLYKGSNPITHIYQNSPFYFATFVGMIIFGTIVQLILCQSPKEKPKPHKQTAKEKDVHSPKKPTWRTT